MDWSELGKKLLGKAAKKRIRKETGQEEPYERDLSSMDDTDRRGMEAIEEANRKRKKGERYECGGVKYSKLKKLIKGKKD